MHILAFSFTQLSLFPVWKTTESMSESFQDRVKNLRWSDLRFEKIENSYLFIYSFIYLFEIGVIKGQKRPLSF